MARVRLSLPLLRAYLRRCKVADPRTKVALVLGAAGAPSAYSAGVVDALLDADVPVDLVIGTSGGALNACLYLLGRLTNRPGLAGEAWGRVTLDQVLAPAWPLRCWQRRQALPGWAKASLAAVFLPCYPLALTLGYAYIRNRQALFSDLPLRRLICSELAAALGLRAGTGPAACGHVLAARWCDHTDAPELLIAALDVSRGRDVLFALAETHTLDRLQAAGWAVDLLAAWPRGRLERPDLLVPALLASAALVPVFPPQAVGGRRYIDGGYTQPLPVGAAVAAGATHALVVEPAVGGDNRAPRDMLAHLRRGAAAVVAASRHHALDASRDRLTLPRLYRLAPGRRLAGALDFDGGGGGGLAQLAAEGRRDAAAGFWWPGV